MKKTKFRIAYLGQQGVVAEQVKLGLSQREMAERLDCTPLTMSNLIRWYEQNARRFETGEALTHALALAAQARTQGYGRARIVERRRILFEIERRQLTRQEAIDQFCISYRTLQRWLKTIPHTEAKRRFPHLRLHRYLSVLPSP